MSKSEDELRARFESIQKEQEARRISGTISMIMAMQGNLLIDLEEEDVDSALAYLQESGIEELEQHRVTWPEALVPHYNAIIEIYHDLKENRIDIPDIAAKIRHYLEQDTQAQSMPDNSL